MNNIKQNSIHTHFYQSSSSHSSSHSNSIPKSAICRNLDENLNNSKDINTSVNYIIASFGEIYNKYISTSSQYTVNISSAARNSCFLLFDSNLKSCKNKSTCTIGIKEQLKEYMANREKLSDDEIIEWLLKQLISNVDSVVNQVSLLMNDSFSRFKKQQPVFDTCLELATKSSSN